MPLELNYKAQQIVCETCPETLYVLSMDQECSTHWGVTLTEKKRLYVSVRQTSAEYAILQRVCRPLLKLYVRGSPFVSCAQFLLQHIRKYLTPSEAVIGIHTVQTRQAVATLNPLNNAMN